eukprot:scaffold263697_cov17-Tisochrysis_lutea.AAC.1
MAISKHVPAISGWHTWSCNVSILAQLSGSVLGAAARRQRGSWHQKYAPTHLNITEHGELGVPVQEDIEGYRVLRSRVSMAKATGQALPISTEGAPSCMHAQINNTSANGLATHLSASSEGSQANWFRIRAPKLCHQRRPLPLLDRGKDACLRQVQDGIIGGATCRLRAGRRAAQTEYSRKCALQAAKVHGGLTCACMRMHMQQWNVFWDEQVRKSLGPARPHAASQVPGTNGEIARPTTLPKNMAINEY